ncbi:MAG: 50S ribosomal protein L19 [Microgenomates group bacterium GW2011_GWA2_39_19]|nr:MAG: 50S ribosomal protein L19 [Microgenomates group bacterium GW2011_GWA2_39_19]
MALSAILNGQEFHVGDTVRVHQRIQEDNKTRIQVFEGTVLAIRGKESGKMYTVRRIGAGSVAIERRKTTQKSISKPAKKATRPKKK